MTEIEPWQVWWADFSPQRGREQDGVRPAIVIGSPLACELPNELATVLPCTTKDRGLPIHPAVDLGQPSFAMCDQMKSISVDRLLKPHPARLSEEDIRTIRNAIRQLIDVG